MNVTALSRSVVGLLSLTWPAVLTTACGLEPTGPPPLTGPSELGLALRVTASPDILPRDGVSTARVSVEARNARSDPVSGLSLWAETVFRGAITDEGRLSSKTVATDASGRAYLTYTAPPGAETDNSDEGNDIVTIRVTPVGDDYAGTVARVVHIRLVPLGVVLPPSGTPLVDFTVSPTTPQAGDLVQLDASASHDCPADATSPGDCTSAASLETVEWLFGDGARGTGKQVTHRYAKPGEYVITLTVTNDRGRSASASKPIEVGEPEG
ncbi:MAG: PKD domain-containing protein [Luteitalea sp.]|nr:PKD domain-containing protein [Luteitalea sp.]